MLCVRTATSTSYSKSYSTRCFASLEDLQRAIVANGWKAVHLVAVNRWDGSWDFHASDIPVQELRQNHLDWLEYPEAADSRHLVCGL
jgi:hypothetical protein